MKPYSIDFREKVVKAYEQGKTSIRKLATRFDVSKANVCETTQTKENSWVSQTWNPGRKYEE